MPTGASLLPPVTCHTRSEELGSYARRPLLPLPCSCTRCSSPSELATHLSSLQCSSCPGTLLPSLPLLLSSPWTCTSCFSTSSPQQVEEVQQHLVATVNSSPLTPEHILEEVLPQLLLTAHPHHHLVLQAKKAAILGLRGTIAREQVATKVR